MPPDSDSLKYLLESHAESLNQHDDIYVGEKLQSSKGQAKKTKALNSFATTANDEALLVIDTTIFGSAAEGFYIDSDCIYVKGFLQDKIAFRIADIKSIFMDAREKKIVINGQSVSWIGDSLNDKMQIIVDCIKAYLNKMEQLALSKGSDYSASLVQQIEKLIRETVIWSTEIDLKISDLEMKEVMNGMAFGSENFLEKIAISMYRSAALNKFDELRQECRERVKSLNSSSIIKEAGKELGEKISLEYDFNTNPDRDTSLSNEEWSGRIEAALRNLRYCADSLTDQLEKLAEKLN